MNVKGAFDSDDYDPANFNDIALTPTAAAQTTNIVNTITTDNVTPNVTPFTTSATNPHINPITNATTTTKTSTPTSIPTFVHTTTNNLLPTTDHTALFQNVFHANPAFAASFMALIQQYQPTPPNNLIPTLPHATLTPHRAPPSTPPTTTPTPYTTTPATHTNSNTHHLSPNPWLLIGHNNTTTPINTSTTAPPNYPTQYLTPTPANITHANKNEPLVGHNNTTTPINTPANAPPNYPTQYPTPTPEDITYTNKNDLDEEEEIAYTQSNFLPTEVTSTNKLPSSTINAFTDLQTHTTSNKETLSLRAEGRVWSRNNINQCTIVIKLAITASAIYDQSPTTKGLEPVIDAIIASINLKFIVNRIAILSFDTAIPTRKHGNVYFSYAFLSPRSTNPTTTPTPSPTTAHRQLEILQGCLHARLDGPHYFDTIPNLPPLASHLRVFIPLINDMDETFRFIIDGISIGLLLGTNGPENTLTLRYLGY
jgi:hypothetical protein